MKKYYSLAALLAASCIVFVTGLGAVEPGSFFTNGPRDKKEIALTFDDGPGNYTPKVLEVLAKYNVKATVSATKDPSTQKDTFQVTVAEAVDVTVATDDKKVAINTTPEGETTVTTSDVNATPISASPEVLEPVVPEIAPTEDVPAVEETPAEEDEDTLMAEKIYVSDFKCGLN